MTLVALALGAAIEERIAASTPEPGRGPQERLPAGPSMRRSVRMSRGGSGGIVDFGVAYDGIADVLAERGRGVQVDTTAKQRRQLVLDGDERIARDVVRFELDEHVNVAVGAEIIAQHRSEQG